ncbi:hypothetical protein SSYM_1418 [Serratia symbiotica str. Tucson]|uniref:Uncharacterized protein n=1 Tax=Serratia symbiotica str. Tucson TaxID=914128 RepID=E9CM95_9GAMM|nr:hypothetical protein SSYM_1418 [Serratia symbiotica str. Tucson]
MPEQSGAGSMGLANGLPFGFMAQVREQALLRLDNSR